MVSNFKKNTPSIKKNLNFFTFSTSFFLKNHHFIKKKYIPFYTSATLLFWKIIFYIVPRRSKVKFFGLLHSHSALILFKIQPPIF